MNLMVKYIKFRKVRFILAALACSPRRQSATGSPPTQRGAFFRVTTRKKSAQRKFSAPYSASSSMTGICEKTVTDTSSYPHC